MEYVYRGGADRRSRRAAFRFVERRTGFDRREPRGTLTLLRDNAWLLALVLALVNALSLADWLLTVHALQRGAIEANILMAGLIGRSWPMALAFKLAVTALVTLGIWSACRYRLVLGVSLFALLSYVALIAYHLGGLALVGGL